MQEEEGVAVHPKHCCPIYQYPYLHPAGNPGSCIPGSGSTRTINSWWLGIQNSRVPFFLVLIDERNVLCFSFLAVSSGCGQMELGQHCYLVQEPVGQFQQEVYMAQGEMKAMEYRERLYRVRTLQNV